MPFANAPAPFEVLVVDDEPETQDLLSEFCRSLGLEVAVASDGRAATAAIESDPARYRVVLTDLHMPGADGFQVLHAARAANASSYVVIITGYATIDTAVRAVREGAYDFLAKPFSLGQLETILWRIRDRMALEQHNRELMHEVDDARQMAEQGPGTTSLDWRLGLIDERLSNIEAALRALTHP